MGALLPHMPDTGIRLKGGEGIRRNLRINHRKGRKEGAFASIWLADYSNKKGHESILEEKV
jgi:hypothetical protein